LLYRNNVGVLSQEFRRNHPSAGSEIINRIAFINLCNANDVPRNSGVDQVILSARSTHPRMVGFAFAFR